MGRVEIEKDVGHTVSSDGLRHALGLLERNLSEACPARGNADTGTMHAQQTLGLEFHKGDDHARHPEPCRRSRHHAVTSG